MGYSNFFFFRQIYYILKRSKRFRIFLLTLIILFVFYKVCFAVDTLSGDHDISQEIIDRQINIQNDFAIFCFNNYVKNSETWTEYLEDLLNHIFDDNYDFSIGVQKTANNIKYNIYTYMINEGTSGTNRTYYSRLNQTFTVIEYTNTHTTYYVLTFDYHNNLANMTTTNNYTYSTPYANTGIRAPLLLEFYEMYRSGSVNYYSILQSISNYLDSINTVDGDILTLLSNLSSTLNTISTNTSTDYSQQISAISGKIDDILDDNQDIISQNAEMIEQQEQINENLEQVSSDIQDVNDTITDDTVESSASDLPSTNVQDPSENGIATIFQSIYNAFCTGQAQDIVFPIPFTNKNITLSPYYVRDMLNNNGAGWVYTLIQAFWGYLIGRFIVSDISKKIDKVKSGNIENIENTNIKEEML